MNHDEDQVPAIVPSWMGQSTLVGPFRTPQSFTLISAEHLLSKLRWDMQQLDAMRWDDNLGKTWRQAVSYKAIDCATSSWHLCDWVARDLVGIEPIQRVCAFLEIDGHDAHRRIPLEKLRRGAIAKCPDLDICRIIVNASKHYEVNHRPRPEIRTSCVQVTARRQGESFQRLHMQLSVFEGDERRDLRDILINCERFWEQLSEVSRPK